MLNVSFLPTGFIIKYNIIILVCALSKVKHLDNTAVTDAKNVSQPMPARGLFI